MMTHLSIENHNLCAKSNICVQITATICVVASTAICSARRGCQQTLNVCLLPIFSTDFNCLYPCHLNSRFPSRERIIQRMLDISQNIFFSFDELAELLSFSRPYNGISDKQEEESNRADKLIFLYSSPPSSESQKSRNF